MLYFFVDLQQKLHNIEAWHPIGQICFVYTALNTELSEMSVFFQVPALCYSPILEFAKYNLYLSFILCTSLL